MAQDIPQSTSYLVVFRAFLASDGKTPATGKTIAVTISKNGGAFGNPAVGALNATEISSGFYKVTLDVTDCGTLGPLAWRGAEATINDAGDVLFVVPATGARWTNLDAAISSRMATYTQPSGFLAATFPATVASPTNITAGTITTTTNLTNLPTAPTDWLTGAATSAAAVTKIQTGLATPTNITTVATVTTLTNLPAAPTDWLTAAALKADAVAEIQTGLMLSTAYTAPDNAGIAAIKARTDNLPSSPAATGDIPNPAAIATAVLTTAMVESYAADGAAPTLAQAVCLIAQRLTEFGIIGTQVIIKKLDGSSTAAILTLDDATTPTASTRSA